MRQSTSCLNAGWLRIFSLLLPVGPPLGFGASDERAWKELVDRLG